ncbi:heparin lyase I family protein [Synechococcus sp. TAK9802]|uniref:heparin lyase I family protein n=1 Tax=Synechococcus sp. TAK9802 TaxID=1442558 RepID=UPI001648887E|nr:heparin lyase I family protein [Synechococcus sp. TAK9802]QNI62850.1 hemolysin-type calcium-binding repeat family protein [Synechococcus sp. TAK9802]
MQILGTTINDKDSKENVGGKLLRADISQLSDRDTNQAISYQWYLDEASIAGATTRDFLIGNNISPGAIRVDATYTSSSGQQITTSSPTITSGDWRIFSGGEARTVTGDNPYEGKMESNIVGDNPAPFMETYSLSSSSRNHAGGGWFDDGYRADDDIHYIKSLEAINIGLTAQEGSNVIKIGATSGSKRAELGARNYNTRVQENQDIYISEKIYLPSAEWDPVTQYSTLIFQHKQYPGADPNFELRLSNEGDYKLFARSPYGHYGLEEVDGRYRHDQYPIATFSPDTWHDLKIHLTPSQDSTKGKITVWLDGQTIFNETGTNLNDVDNTNDSFMKLGMYTNIEDDRHYFVDAVEMATFLPSTVNDWVNGTTPDTTTPTLTITDNITGSANGEIVFSFQFSEAVSGFTADDITISSNASKGSFSGSDGDSSYTLSVTPDSNSTGTITVDVDADVATDAAGNGNDAATQASQTFDTTTPTFSSAATSTDGSKVVLTYNEALSATTAAANAFTVTTDGAANAVTAVDINGSTVELTLTNAVKNDQTLTVAYTDPSGSNDSNAVQDSQGNDAASLSSTSVTNNSNVAGTPPVITGPSGSAGDATSSKSIPENTTAVSQLTANEAVTWSLSGGADAAKFQVDANGNLSFQAAPDFENPNDLGNTANNNTYVVTVRATDTAGNTADQTVTTTVTDVDETAVLITGSSGSAGAATSAKSIQENITGVHRFTANETVTWSLSGGADASLFDINSSSGTLSFKTAPDYENPTDNDKNNEYVVVVRATDAQNNTSDQTHTVTIADIGEKTNSDDTFYKLSYKKTDNSTITPLFSPTFGTINGALTLNRLSSAPTISNKPSGLSIGQTGIDFELLLGNTALNGKGKTTIDLAPLVDGLTTTGKNIAYFSYTETGDGSSPTATTLTYDPTKKAGARFYDLSGDGNADTVNLELVDGGYGDKDGIKNGTILDPSTAGVVDLTPVFTASTTALTVADASDTTSPAAFNLTISISSMASTVNQIGYVALNANESDTLTYDLIKNRGSILLSNVENSGAPNLSSMDLTADISLINTQKLIFFEVVDTTLESLLANNTNLDGFGSSFNILNLSDTSTNSAIASNGGNTIAIALQQGFSGVNDLIASDLGFNPILDFSGFAGLSLEGSVSVAREAQYNSTVGFYKIQNSNGAVSDPITGDLITPDETGYKEAALHSTNLFSSLGTLSTSDGNTITSSITSFSDSEMIAPYASVHDTDQTYFSFAEANADGISHFREFGNGVIGLEDLHGGGDNDFDDFIFGFDLKLTV